MPSYERGQVRIHYEEVGSGFPLLVIPGGGLNSTVAGLATHPFNPFDEFKASFVLSRPICATPRVASPPVRLRSIGLGTPIPTTISA
jgi:hypothetical protein